MKLYAGFAPNAFRVLAFVQEKGIEIPTESLNVLEGDTRQPEHLARNSLGEIPVLEFDDGSYLAESVAICRYLESRYPEPPLLGSDAQEQARVEMWNRRMEQQIMGPCGDIGLHTIPIFADRVIQVPEYAETLTQRMRNNWQWLDSELADGRDFICGDDFTIADITGMSALMIHQIIELEVPNELSNVQRWVANVQQRPCWNH